MTKITMNEEGGSYEALQSELREAKAALERSQKRESSLLRQIQLEREKSVHSFAIAEAEEERIINSLNQRLATLKKEKESLLCAVEREEEMMTNTLQRQLQELRKEKVELENKLEQEQEYVVNKLHKQLSRLQMEKDALEAKLHVAQQEFIRQVDKGLEASNREGDPELLQHVANSIDKLRLHQDALDDARSSKQTIISKLQRDNERLRNENQILRAKVTRNHSDTLPVGCDSSLGQRTLSFNSHFEETGPSSQYSPTQSVSSPTAPTRFR